MYLKQTKHPSGRIYLSVVHGYRDKNNKSKQKTIKSFGYLDELQKSHSDPIEYIKNEIAKMTGEKLNEITIKGIDQKPDYDDPNIFKNDEKNIGYFLLKKIYLELGITNFLKEKQKK